MSFGWAPLGRVKAGYYNSACITLEADKSLIIYIRFFFFKSFIRCILQSGN